MNRRALRTRREYTGIHEDQHLGKSPGPSGPFTKTASAGSSTRTRRFSIVRPDVITITWRSFTAIIDDVIVSGVPIASTSPPVTRGSP